MPETERRAARNDRPIKGGIMIKQLAKSVREYKRDTILTPIYVTAEVVLEVLIPLVTSYLIGAI